MNTERDMFLREKLNTGLFIEFKTWDGFGILWEWSSKWNWWEDFLVSLDIIKGYEGHLVDIMAICSPEEFADAIYEFLKEKR